MAEDSVSAIIESTCTSAASLRSTIQAIPDLEGSNLAQQLQDTIFACRSVQGYSEFLRLAEPEKARGVVNIIKYLGQYAQEVKSDIERACRDNAPQWNTFKIRGRDVAGIAASFQMHISSVFIGAVGEARARGLIKAQAELQEIIEATKEALIGNQKFLSEKISQFFRR